MNIWLIAFILVICIIALVATFMVIKQEERKMKQYEETGDTAKSELQRSHEYETKSLSSNVKSLTWIYVVVIGLSFIVFGLYMYMR
ncbi:hypothetical protein [Ornithinibacillus scapharcae]|uniref:hypothetical protein n=1 Tax=Ornithinibacillus scapharcae TaxID=1147159 RepID=UPI000225B0CF|nr:hypothetical protein [Ornithinibacillus scapharcae]